MITILVHPGSLLKLTMPLLLQSKRIIQTPKTKHITQKDERVLIPQGLACSWSCMQEGYAMRVTKRMAGQQPDILKYLGKYSFEAKAATRLP